MPAPVDLRSDTVTLPTPGMRRAMARARVGDARRGEDPSVRALEEAAAGLFGKEAGLFLPSGTMANLCAVAAWTRPGDLVAASDSSHIARRESPAVSLVASAAVAGIDSPKGTFTAGAVAAAVAAAAGAESNVALVAAENTHNAAGGTVFPLADLAEIHAFCGKARIPLHLDGSRIFNACVASGTAPAAYGKVSDSLMFCVSKGLGGPVGSVLLGTRDFLFAARAVALRIGGGMRQAGIVAAGGLYALKHHVGRLAEDHANAALLAKGIRGIPGLEIRNAPVATNIVLFRWRNPRGGAPAFRQRLADRGILLDDRAFPDFRAVTHLGIGEREISRALRALREICAGGKRNA